MAELYIRGKDGRPRLIGKTADPELPGRMAALEERMEALETAPGGVPLSDAVDSASSTTAATSKAVKTAYDAGVTAQEAAEAAKTAANAASKAYITEQWYADGLWYRKWNDGFIEQGGWARFESSIITITLNVPFSDYKYNVVASKLMGGEVEGYAPEQGPVAIASRNLAFFKVGTGAEWERDKHVMWYASGY